MTLDPCAQRSFPLCFGVERIISQERRVPTMNCVSSTADAYRDVQYIADTPPRAATRAPSPHLHPPTPLREDQRAATRAPSPHLHPPTPLQEDQYATIPVVAVKPAFQQADEEELHTSFEQAI